MVYAVVPAWLSLTPGTGSEIGFAHVEGASSRRVEPLLRDKPERGGSGDGSDGQGGEGERGENGEGGEGSADEGADCKEQGRGGGADHGGCGAPGRCERSAGDGRQGAEQPAGAQMESQPAAAGQSPGRFASQPDAVTRAGFQGPSYGVQAFLDGALGSGVNLQKNGYRTRPQFALDRSGCPARSLL